MIELGSPGPTGNIDEAPVDILVVGGGPVGLAAALDLGTRGVRVLLVDESDGIANYPTAESVDTRTMEWLRQLRVSDAVQQSGFPDDYPRDIAFVTTLSGHELARFPRPDNANRFAATEGLSPEAPVWWPKFWFDTALRSRAAELPNVTMRYRWRCESTSQDAEGVTADLVSSDGVTRRVQSRYLVACDGGRSAIRRQYGIAMDGSAREARWQSALVEIPALLDRINFAPAVQYYLLRPRRLIFGSLDGRALWRVTYPLQDGEEPTPPEVAATVSAGIGRADVEVTVHDTRSWTGNTIVASTFRTGRIFLAGDAAHQMWPSGGHGMNTGIGDVANLGWKLALALRTATGPSLLDSYEAERKPIALRNTSRAAHNYAADLALTTSEDLDDTGERGVAARGRAARQVVTTRETEWRSVGVQLGFRYIDSPIIWYDTVAEPPSDDASRYMPVIRPGHRAPHAWLDHGSSTIDLFRLDHVLLRLDTALSVDGWVDQFASWGAQLDVIDLDDTAKRAYAGAALVLVRPDGMIAWHGPADADAARIAAVVLGRPGRAATNADAVQAEAIAGGVSKC
jgi:2-polyprenyl-6-methoxyphenol hydroxylase-like FAD-dependent oxidoreductase